jgi:putative transcriptional regulator
MNLRLPHVAALVAAVALAAAPTAAGTTERALTGPENFTGKLLVAAPTMEDPHFEKTVIFVVEHSEEGALGIVVNRVLGSGPASEILEGLGVDANGATGQLRLYLGGPVSPQVAFVVHSPDYADSRSHAVTDHISVTSDAAILKAISRGKGPSKELIAIGYAGWGPGQLESEMARNTWYVAPADEAIIFSDDADSAWQRALAISGVEL